MMRRSSVWYLWTEWLEGSYQLGSMQQIRSTEGHGPQAHGAVGAIIRHARLLHAAELRKDARVPAECRSAGVVAARACDGCAVMYACMH